MGNRFLAANNRNKEYNLLPSIDSSVSIRKLSVLDRPYSLRNKISSYSSILSFVKFLPTLSFNNLFLHPTHSRLTSTLELPQTRHFRPTFKSYRITLLSDKDYTLIPKIKKPTFKISKDGRQ